MNIKNLDGNNPVLEEDDGLYQEGYYDDNQDYYDEDDGYYDDDEYYDEDDGYYDDEYYDDESISETDEKVVPEKKKVVNYSGTNGIFTKRSEVIDDEDEYEDYDDDEDYDEDEEDFPRRRIKRKVKGLKLSLALMMTFIILGISAVLSITIISLAREYLGVDKSTTTYIIDIPEGASTDEIIDILYDNNIIQVKELFKLAIKVSDDGEPLVAGEHQISPSMDYGDMVEELKTNIQDNRDVVTVTFPEGINVYDASKILEDKGVCDARNFIYYFNGGFDLSEYRFNNYLPNESTLKFLKLEGYLFPDTYEFYKDEEPEIVARKIFDNFDKKITDEYYTQMDSLNLSLDEVITLASIVQKEASNVKDMKLIASVFHNRLNNPDIFPMLQSDPTRVYAEEVIHEKLDVANTTMEDAYNTYKSAGLPPGAICNPGIEAIEAVLYPVDSNYFYFCADVETGETYYAETLEEHNANLELAGISLED